jgi:hypothetical protein
MLFSGVARLAGVRRGAVVAAIVGSLFAASSCAAAPRVGQPPTASSTASPSTSAGPSTTWSVTPSASGKPSPTERPWRIGATPLPRRADGFGVIRPTPPQLVDRRLPTVDRLPPPAGRRFVATVREIGRDVRARMGTTWQPSCPVRLIDLRYLTIAFWGFDGRPHTGELVVNGRVAQDVVAVFRRLHDGHFPIEEMRLVTPADLDAPPTGDGNNTAGFVCRPARGQTRWSAHAYGLAIDLDPFQNPYHRRDLVLPELASTYLDRSRVRPGMVLPGSVAVRAFAAIGWTWGGTWRAPNDPMHFTATGN